MDIETARESILKLWDSGELLFHRYGCRVALSLYAFKKLGASIPKRFEDHITKTIQGMEADDAVDIIRRYNFWDYDSER